MISRCDFSDFFGKPRVGIHSIRLFDIAIIDVIMTILGGYIITKLINKYTKWRVTNPLIILMLFILGHLLHLFFCVDTKLVQLLT